MNIVNHATSGDFQITVQEVDILGSDFGSLVPTTDYEIGKYASCMLMFQTNFLTLEEANMFGMITPTRYAEYAAGNATDKANIRFAMTYTAAGILEGKMVGTVVDAPSCTITMDASTPTKSNFSDSIVPASLVQFATENPTDRVVLFYPYALIGSPEVATTWYNVVSEHDIMLDSADLPTDDYFYMVFKDVPTETERFSTVSKTTVDNAGGTMSVAGATKVFILRKMLKTFNYGDE